MSCKYNEISVCEESWPDRYSINVNGIEWSFLTNCNTMVHLGSWLLWTMDAGFIAGIRPYTGMGGWGSEDLKAEVEGHRWHQPVNLKAKHIQLPKWDQKGNWWRGLWETHLLKNLGSLLNSRVNNNMEQRLTTTWNSLAPAYMSITQIQAWWPSEDNDCCFISTFQIPCKFQRRPILTLYNIQA